MTTTPYNHPALYRSVNIGGVDSPGKVTLSGFARKHKWEVREPKGQIGTSTLNHGAKNGGFTASFNLADQEDCEAWDEFQRMLDTARAGGKALGCYHPDLVRNQIIDCVVEEIGDMVHDDKGGASVVCKFIEYRPPKKKPATKPQAGTGRRTGTTTVNDPNAARKAELAELTRQAREP